MAVSDKTNEHQIRELEKQLRQHCHAAIQLNEPPGGFHRNRAEYLQKKIHGLRSSRPINSKDNWILPLSIVLGLWLGSGTVVFASGLIGIYSRLMSRPVAKALITKQVPPAPPDHAWAPDPQASRMKPDPALAMNGRFYGSKLGGIYSTLDEGFNNYQRLSGTLARIQAIALRRQSAAKQLPSVWINRTRKDCFDRSSIGVYSPKCQVLKLDYTDGNSAFEYPVEIEVTLAHEWGHHLIALSGVGMSPTEQEVVSDCFAGVVFGYYAKNKLISVDDAMHAVELMERFGNNSPYGVHPNQEIRVRAFGVGLFSVANPSDPAVSGLRETCSSLNAIIDISKVREMGLTWRS